MTNTLYLEKRGCDNYGDRIDTDITNFRVNAVKYIPIEFEGVRYETFFEFSFWERYAYRTTAKRTGRPLKHPVKELVNRHGLHIDTQYNKPETDRNGKQWFSSWRLCRLEEQVARSNPDYTRADVLKVVNTFAINPFDSVAFIDEVATDIINEVGGYRERDILSGSHYFTVTETWNDDRKVVKVVNRDNGNSCEVDLVTRTITG